VSGAVVSISVRSRQDVRPQSPWDFFFVPEQSRVLEGYGTGFIIRPDGIILTNQHVVAKAERVVVTLPDGSDLPAKVLGEDPLTDIAVLRVDRKRLPAVTTGRSTDLMIGEWVVALGNPYAYMLGNAEPTVTVGVVSATGRNILPSGDQTGLYFDMIQTDAAINPGNSGGPLTNALGEVIGVNSSIFSSSGGSVGLGFAIPIERALRVADEIIKNGSVRRAWIGLEVQGASAMHDWKSAGGVTVASVAPGGPAAKAGLRGGSGQEVFQGQPFVRGGDVITKVGDVAITNSDDLARAIARFKPGDQAEVEIHRGGATQTLKVTLGERPTDA
jgi:serine protease Do